MTTAAVNAVAALNRIGPGGGSHGGGGTHSVWGFVAGAVLFVIVATLMLVRYKQTRRR